MGLLMGAPILDNILSRLASSLQTFVFQQDTDQHLSGTEIGGGVKTKGSSEEQHSLVRTIDRVMVISYFKDVTVGQK